MAKLKLKIYMKECKYCNKKFNSKFTRQIYCSKDCSRLAGNKKNFIRAKLNGKRNYHKETPLSLIKFQNCKVCNKLISSSASANKLYCSKECKNKERYNKNKVKYKIWRDEWISNPANKKRSQKLQKQWLLNTDKGRKTHTWDQIRKRINKFTGKELKTKRSDMEKIIGCSRTFLHNYLQKSFYNHPINKKEMSWDNFGEWHIDHKIPLAKLDPKNDKHFKIANHFCNLQPMWAEENLRKSSKVTPGYGVAYLKRKYKILQTLGDLTKISNEIEAKVIIKQASKLF